MVSKTHTITILLAALLTLSLFLAACGTGGNTPLEDSSTPGVSNTPNANTEPPTTAPDNTPSETESAPPGISNKEPVVLLSDPEDINDEYLDKINRNMPISDTDNVIDEIYEKYGKYLNENISKLCLKVGLYAVVSIQDDTTMITPEALNKVNDLLIANGEEPLGTTDPKQKIAALWIAASLYYDPAYNDEVKDFLEKWPGHRFDIGRAFALTKYLDLDDVATYEDIYASRYANLFNIP